MIAFHQYKYFLCYIVGSLTCSSNRLVENLNLVISHCELFKVVKLKLSLENFTDVMTSWLNSACGRCASIHSLFTRVASFLLITGGYLLVFRFRQPIKTGCNHIAKSTESGNKY